MKSFWYENFFGTKYLDLYLPYLGKARTEKEINGLLDLIGSDQKQTILDLCCGHGRHAISLAQKGYKVTGQDLSKIFIDKARADAREQNIDVDFIKSDMRILPQDSKFDIILNLFNSFGYLESREEDFKVIDEVYKHLKPNGKFIQEVSNSYQLVRNLKESNTFDYPDELMYETKQFKLETGIVEVKYEIYSKSGGKPHEMYHKLQTYTPYELIEMHKSAGFTVVNILGSLNGKPLTLNSPHIIVVSQKK